MPLRTGHGTGKGQPRIEVIADELPKPVPLDGASPAQALTFRPDGKIADSETAKELGRRGGLARAGKIRLLDSLGLSKLVDQTTFGPYRQGAEEFVKFHCSILARQAGGELGPAPSTMVASAGLQLAASRWAFDRGAEENDPSLIKLGSSLANDSRQNLLAAYELAVREAQARAANSDPRDDMRARILGDKS